MSDGKSPFANLENTAGSFGIWAAEQKIAYRVEERDMCKKFLTVGILGAVAVAGLVSTGAWSYVRTGIHTAHQSVKDSVPIDWEIKRARDMIEDLEPEIARNLEVVLKEEVAVDRLAQQIQDKETQLAKSRGDILRLKNDLESGSVRFVYAGRSYSDEQVRADLANRFERFKVFEATTDKLSQVLDARQKNLLAARQKLEEMQSAKRELEVEIENLQARQTMVEVAQTSNPVTLDDSQLSHTRQLLDDIRTRIDVAEKMSASAGALNGSIQLDDDQTSADLLNEIADYMGDADPEIEVLLSNNKL